MTGATSSITVSVFPGGFNWPLFVAIDTGLFAQNGLSVSVMPTAGSMAQMTDFAAGRFEITMTAFDNIVAYVSGDGEAPIGAQPGFVAFLGSDDSFLSLAARPEITTIATLRDHAISVDAATTGYAFVLFEMLRRAGLDSGSYLVERVGGMAQRYDDLCQGGHAATMLSTPYDGQAEAAGLRILARARTVIGAYQGNVAAAHRDWADANPAIMAGFIRAYGAAIAWLRATANHADAMAILNRHVSGMTDTAAQTSAAIMLDPVTGFFADGRISEAGANCVLDLRRRYWPASGATADLARYIVTRWWQMAA